MPPFRTAVVSQERSKLISMIRSMQWLLHYKSLTSRPIGSDKAGRWSSRGTLTSSCLRDLCPQADSIHKTGSVIAAEEILIYLLTHRSSWSLSLLKRGLQGDPAWIQADVIFYLLEAFIVIAPEPELTDALPYLSNSGFIRNVIYELF